MNKMAFFRVSLITLVFAAIGAMLAYTVFLSFKSHASVSFPLDLQEYKVMSEVIGSPESFDRYALSVAHNRKDTSDAAVARLDNLRKTVISGMSTWFEPILRISKVDRKEFSGEASNLGEGSALIGYRISTKAGTPDEAQQQTAFLAKYVIDSNLRELLVAKIRKAVNQRLIFSDSTAAEQAEQKYNVSMLEERLKQLKRISIAYPTVNRAEARQVISLEKGGERYMPLPSQMAAVETEILDINERIERSSRGLRQSVAEGEMLDAQSKIVKASLSGQDLMDSLIADTEARLSKAGTKFDNELFLNYVKQYTDLKIKYLESPRFIVAPQIPVKPSFSPRILVLLFVFLGLFVSVAYEIRYQLLTFLRSFLIAEDTRSQKADYLLERPVASA